MASAKIFAEDENLKKKMTEMHDTKCSRRARLPEF